MQCAKLNLVLVGKTSLISYFRILVNFQIYGVLMCVFMYSCMCSSVVLLCSIDFVKLCRLNYVIVRMLVIRRPSEHEFMKSA